ncbi:MAG: hypothetical protein WC763_05270 [Candidatus Paceibacterota bacterium]
MAIRTERDEVLHPIVLSFATFIPFTVDMMDDQFFSRIAELAFLPVSFGDVFLDAIEAMLVMIPIEQFAVLTPVFRILLYFGVTVSLIPTMAILAFLRFVVRVVFPAPTPSTKARIRT